MAQTHVNPHVKVKVKIKIKATLEQATTVPRRSSVIALLSL
jgi:hypothetical protein